MSEPVSEPVRIVPQDTELTAPFWAAAARGQVLLQRCRDCAAVWHPPAPTCPAHPSHRIEWFAASGQGRLHSYTRVEHAAHPAVAAGLPYLVALIELAEGPLFICNLAEADRAALVLDAPVTLSLGPAVGGLELPVARLVG
jgi:uncharacterized OB-fold protein